ncbi:hypothetical protein IJ22_04910 [Paenibacillus naphthalenovorans]|uniref:Uncharacterized protein n=1 Tax=Paenibacillus naphthalenovorans TaxID=162209 RepID=A0A0U2MU46_9BACL|nr:hypothetical protein IJ22_04910 [Paenibacillus naphthalenovorans]
MSKNTLFDFCIEQGVLRCNHDHTIEETPGMGCPLSQNHPKGGRVSPQARQMDFQPNRPLDRHSVFSYAVFLGRFWCNDHLFGVWFLDYALIEYLRPVGNFESVDFIE